MENSELNHSDASADQARLDEIIGTIEDENLPIEEALSLLDEAIKIGSEACTRTSKVLADNI